ncbi:hypothetical protein [Halalkalibacterium ligniniphilum]|uniref:hypothetical protein n=1 Tax=Halalkalibacterium ligniniphilum TaxID=1134413 RepID=UPI00034B8273|nr:hypothetical protein [Halalkalibacterium ligniniphilum]
MAPKKRFGLDIDGTVTHPGTFIPYLNHHFQKELTLDDIKEYDLTGLLEITTEDFWKWMEVHEGTIYQEAELAEHADKVLHEWQKEHELIYITARGQHLADITKNWFLHHTLPFDHIELVGKHDKLEAVRSLNIDIFFEDKHDNAVAIAEEFNIPVILMDTPYNRLPAPNNVIRVTSWLEARSWVDTWLKQHSYQ